MKQLYFVSTAVMIALIGHAGPLWACAVCVSGSDAGADGYNASVLFLMSTPYLVVGSIAGGLFLMVRRAAQRNSNSAAEPPPNDYETRRTAVDE